MFWVGRPLWLANDAPSADPRRGRLDRGVARVARIVVLRDTSPWRCSPSPRWCGWPTRRVFAGKRFGRRKLAPAVSPGKTWEGVFGALAGVAVYGVVLCEIADHYQTPFSALFEPSWGVPAILAMLALVGVSVVGDLFESWMKRGAGLKDSSALLPGHGGVLDRIDALTSTLPVAALACTAAG